MRYVKGKGDLVRLLFFASMRLNHRDDIIQVGNEDKPFSSLQRIPRHSQTRKDMVH